MKEVKVTKQEKVYEVVYDGQILKSFFSHLPAVSYALANCSNLSLCQIREAVYYVFEGGLHDYKEDF